MNDLIDALAVLRITRLVTEDTITRPLRVRVIRAAYVWRDGGRPDGARSEAEWDDMPRANDDAPKLAAFLVCPWCVGMWVAFGVSLARRFAPEPWSYLAQPLALSAAAAVLLELAE